MLRILFCEMKAQKEKGGQKQLDYKWSSRAQISFRIYVLLLTTSARVS